jgi:hypothetical protein
LISSNLFSPTKRPASKLIITLTMCWRTGSLSRLEFINQLFELLLAIRAIFPARFEGRSDLLDVLDVFSDFLLFGLDFVQTSVDTAGQAAELLLFEAPFFSSKSRWIDSRTSFKASAIRRPGGWRGHPLEPGRTDRDEGELHCVSFLFGKFVHQSART